MEERVHIAASCDDNYAQHVGVMFQSLLENTASPLKIKCHLISNGISQKNQLLLNQIVQKFGSTLHIIAADNSKYADLPTSRYGQAAYQRISLADYLPPSIKKVIYLDSDIIVLGDIERLWNMPLKGQALGAIENLSPKACKHLALPRQEYFNSGVMLIDLNEWRKGNIYQQAVELVNKHQEKLRYFDQCTLNMIFRNRWEKLPLQWNQQSDIYGVLKKYANGCGYLENEIKAAITNPSIVHFIGKQKPWLINCYHPFKTSYQHYLSKTPWKGTVEKDRTLGNMIKHYCNLKRILKKIIRTNKIELHHDKK